MSRHTLPDGITPDPEINERSYDLWRQDLAPPGKLVGAFYRIEIGWVEYEKEYLRYLSSISDKIRELANQGLEQNITFLCIEAKADECHRRLLAEECKKYEPSLELLIN